MKIYLDESGDFAIPKDSDCHAVGIVTGIVIPENRETEVFGTFDEFVSHLQPLEFDKKEPKGNLLTDESASVFSRFFAASDGLLVCPIMIDLTLLSRQPEVDVKAAVCEKLRQWAALCKHDVARCSVTKLANQVGNMSTVQILRLATWAKCIMRCVIDSVVFHSGAEFDECWNEIRFEIDPVDRRPGKGEQPVFRTMLPAWICGWSANEPIKSIDETHTPDHPFVKNFDTPLGIDFGKIVKGNVKYPSSENSRGIQIADIASSAIVARAVRGVTTAQDLHNYGLRMTRAIGPPLEATGLFSLVEPSLKDWKKRYYGLPEAIDAAKKVM